MKDFTPLAWFEGNRFNISKDRRIRALKFLVIGALAALAYIATMAMMVERIGTSAALGAVAAFVVGTIISYIGNSLFTFQAPLTGRSAFRFGLVVLAGLVTNVAMAWVLEGLGMYHLFISLIILAIVPMQNFILHELWTFRGKRS